MRRCSWPSETDRSSGTCTPASSLSRGRNCARKRVSSTTCYVDETARRGGIATALLEAAAEWLASRGMPRIVLWTAAPNDAARRLFERLGFRHTMTEMTREL